MVGDYFSHLPPRKPACTKGIWLIGGSIADIFEKNNFVREGRMLRVDIAGIDSSNC